MVVVIGPRGPEPAGLWAVAQALGQGTRVIPVLVGRARMPERHELPAELQLLARRQPVMVRDASFEYDVDRLVGAISRIPPAAHATPSAVELQHLLDRAAWMGIVPAPSLLRPGRGWGVQYERSPDISDAADEWPMERPRPQLRGWRALRAVAFAAVAGGLAYLIADRSSEASCSSPPNGTR